MSVVLLHTERFVEHETPPGHPERPERAEIFDVVAGRWRGRGIDVVAPQPATDQHLARVHTREYLELIRQTRGRSTRLDPDTYTSPESQEVALLAAGAAVDAVDRAMGGSYRSAVALVRPPGHHAERDRAMGFCLYNNIAVGAAHARAIGAGRVAIVDFDVHHGNGTQHIFETDPHVLYISTHQFPYYPGTGAADEIGHGPGTGFTVNVPLEAGAAADDFHLVFSEVVLPVLRQFKPDLLLISAGFDAHENDPLGGMRLTADAFGAMTAELRGVAEACCQGRIVTVTEGGYDLHALAASLDATIGALHGPARDAQWPPGGRGPGNDTPGGRGPGSDRPGGRGPGSDHVARRGHAAVAQVRRAQRAHWRLDGPGG
ncbi:MAG TPA: histone deacetylase [Vicinamibacterales bacterium]|jgi:acetoin utilization deacetylase AcuC-like enzyme|nr:histone deacetylase [Vicinamibacterales bacterium]